jgi:YD repeat-containing protein
VQNRLITASTLGGLVTRWTYNGFGELASNTARYSDAVL